MLRSLLISLALSAGPLLAHAQDQSPCPADAEQQLYTMAGKIEAGQQAETAPVLELAKWAIETCPDRAHAQAIAALLMASVLGTAQDIPTFSDYLTLTYRAVVQNDMAWETSPPKVIVTKLDGTQEDFFGYNFASRIYKDPVLPGFIRLWQNGSTHPLVSGAEPIQCPFARADSDRLDDELLFWGKVAGAQEVRDRYTLIRTRLKTLHTACPEDKGELSWALAYSYGLELVRLTDWDSETVGMSMFGTDLVEYTIPAFPGEFFDRTEMETKKAELDEKARQIVPLVKQYVEDYEAAFKAVDTSTLSSREKRTRSDNAFSRRLNIKQWEEAITELERSE